MGNVGGILLLIVGLVALIGAVRGTWRDVWVALWREDTDIRRRRPGGGSGGGSVRIG